MGEKYEKTIEGKTFPNERDLYNLQNTRVVNCRFEGKADGESALKECRNVCVQDCFMDLRYPLWHAQNFELLSSEQTENCRAALWYSHHGKIADCKLNGIKVLRECSDVQVQDCTSNSTEFG